MDQTAFPSTVGDAWRTIIERNRNVPKILAGLAIISIVWVSLIATAGYGTRWAVPVSGFLAVVTAYIFHRLRRAWPEEHLLGSALVSGRDLFMLVACMSAIFTTVQWIAASRAEAAAKGGTLDGLVKAIDLMTMMISPERLLFLRLALLALALLAVLALVAAWRSDLFSALHKRASLVLRWTVLIASALGAFALQGTLADGDRLTEAAGFRVQMNSIVERYEKTRKDVNNALVLALVEELDRNSTVPDTNAVTHLPPFNPQGGPSATLAAPVTPPSPNSGGGEGLDAPEGPNPPPHTPPDPNGLRGQVAAAWTASFTARFDGAIEALQSASPNKDSGGALKFRAQPASPIPGTASQTALDRIDSALDAVEPTPIPKNVGLKEAVRGVTVTAGEAFVTGINPDPILSAHLGPDSGEPLVNSADFLSALADGPLFDGVNEAASAILAAAMSDGGKSLKTMVRASAKRLAATPSCRRAIDWMKSLKVSVRDKKFALQSYLAGNPPGPELAAIAFRVARARVFQGFEELYSANGLTGEQPMLTRALEDRLDQEPLKNSPENMWKFADEVSIARLSSDTSGQFLARLIGQNLVIKCTCRVVRGMPPPTTCSAPNCSGSQIVTEPLSIRGSNIGR